MADSTGLEAEGEDLIIKLPSGLHLEANFLAPTEVVREHKKLAVCLHPWSWLGGRKEDPCLSLLVEPLLEKTYHIIRYNSRGVGRSSGWPSLTGFTEAKDLEDLVAWAIHKIGNVESVLIVGYSHGSLIASMFPVLSSVKTSHLLLSYPLGPRSWLTMFHSSSYTSALNDLLQRPDSNVLVVFGTRDEFTSHSKYKEWASGMTGQAEIVEVENGTHFWHGRPGHELVVAVRNLRQRPGHYYLTLLRSGRFLASGSPGLCSFLTQVTVVDVSIVAFHLSSSSFTLLTHIVPFRVRPLPDERPRQSVANLIGRFETQTKRLSLSAGTPSRSNSVVSHVTGDSSKEEVKEKREWPPKSVTDKTPPTSFRPIPPALSTRSVPPSDKDDADVPLTARALNASQKQVPDPNTFLENWRKDLPKPTEMVPEPASAVPAPEKVAESQATPTTASVKKFNTPSTPRTPAPKTTATKPSTATPVKTPAKTTPKTPGHKPSLSTTSQPIKPQLTGQSVVSSATTARRAAAAKTPSTPQPKTPARDLSRAKTPTSARPKTPSTGLFAPTAASLARARNAAPPPPQPVKKATLSSSSMERLSKPTAATLAKARSNPPPAAKTPSTPPRVSAAKAKATASPSPSKVKAPVTSKAAGGAAVAATVAAVGAAVSAAPEVAEAANEPGVTDTTNGTPEDAPEESVSEAPEVTVEDPEEELHEDPEEEVALAPAEDGPEEDAPEDQVEEGLVDNEATPKSPSPAVEHEESEAAIEEPEVSVSQKTDIEDIVNLLESVPISKTTDVDVVDEIPDIADEV